MKKGVIETICIYGTLGLIAISFAFIYRNQIKNVTLKTFYTIFSKDIENELLKLPKKAQDKFRLFIKDIQSLGYKVYITSGYRSFKKQSELEKQNINNAKSGFSHHNYGTGIDINISKNGKIYKKSTPKSDWEKTKIPQLAKTKYNMRWGGDFKGYHDPIHFDLENHYPVNELYALGISKFGSKGKIVGNMVLSA